MFNVTEIILELFQRLK